MTQTIPPFEETSPEVEAMLEKQANITGATQPAHNTPDIDYFHNFCSTPHFFRALQYNTYRMF